MKRNISRIIYLILGALLLSFGTALIGLKAQKKEVQRQMEQLHRAILESQKKNLPKTIIKQAESLIQLAKQEQSFPYLAYATQCFWQSKRQLDFQNEEEEKQMFKAYDTLEQIKWLSDEECCVLSLIKLQVYSNFALSSGAFYHAKEENYGTREEQANPRYWSKAQYIKFINRELDKIFANKSLFNHSAKAYELLDLNKDWYFRDIKSKWTETIGGLVFLTSSVAIGGYHSVYNVEVEGLPIPTERIKQELTNYIKSASDLACKLGAKYLYYQLWEEDKNLDKLYAMWRPYFGKKALIPYLPNLFNQFIFQSKQRLVWEKILEIEKAYPHAPKEIKEGIKQAKELALKPQMFIHNRSPYVVGHKNLKILVKHRQLQEVKVSAYAIPYLGKHQKEYKPKAGEQAIKEQVFTLEEDKDWDIKTDTICFNLPKLGHYYLKFTPKFKPRIAKAYDLSKKEQEITMGKELYLTNKYALINAVSPYPLRLQWLNAMTGEPLNALKVFQELEVRNGLISKKTHTTDANGFISMGKDFDGRERSYMTALDKADPLSFMLRTAYNRVWEKIPDENTKREVQVKALVLLDRPIYKRGQKIEIFGFLAGITSLAEEGRVLANEKLNITLTSTANWSENLVKEFTCTSDEYGRFAWSYELPSSASLGSYKVRVFYKRTWGEELIGEKDFRVEAYQRPTYELSVKKPQQGYRLGDTLEIESLVKEMNGSPLKDCRLTYSIRRSLYFWHYFGRGETAHLPQIELKSDAEGRAKASIVLTKDDKQNKEKALYLFDINVQATSPTGEVQSKNLQLLVGDELVYIDLNLPKFIEQTSKEDKCLLKVTDFAHNDLAYGMTCKVLDKRGRTCQSFKAKSNEEFSIANYLSGLNKGIYTLEVSLRLKNGEELKQEKQFILWDKKSEMIDFIDDAFFVKSSSPTFELGKNLELYYATPFDKPYVFYEVYLHTGKLLKKGLLRPLKNKLCRLALPVPKALDHHLDIRLYFVHNAQLYERQVQIKGLQKERKLSLKWEVMRHRILAGSKEEWRAKVYQEGKPTVASVSAWLYDASLNSLVHSFTPQLLPSKREGYSQYSLSLKPFAYQLDIPKNEGEKEEFDCDDYEISMDSKEGLILEDAMDLRGAKVRSLATPMIAEEKPLAIRKDFSETAFCFPKKLTTEDGTLRLSFTMPESLTRWQFYLIAHTKDLHQMLYSDEIETYRELELKPFMPRFLRSGDEVEIAYSLRNLSDKADKVKVQVQYYLLDEDETFKEANIIDRAIMKLPKVQSYKLAPKEQIKGSFPLNVPNYESDKRLGIRIQAIGKRFSDGEEHTLDIQGNGVQVQRTQAITLASEMEEGTSELVRLDSIYPKNFDELGEARFNFSLESNPLLYTIDALPSLSPKKYSKNAFDLLTNYYALAVSHKLTKIDGFSDYLREQCALKGTSPTLSAFFSEISDDNFVKKRETLLLEELKQLQDKDGNFSWFKGMHKSDYITEYVLMQLLRREQITKPSKEALTIRKKAWKAYQNIIKKELKDLKKYNKTYPKLNYLPTRLMNFLFLSSEMSGASSSASESKLFAQVLAVVQANKEQTYQLPLLQKLRAYYALASNEPKLAKDLMQSIKEHIVRRADGACFFPSADSYYWRNPQYALQTEMLLYLVHFEPQEKALIRGLKQWLLREKRTTQWESSVATLDAIYGLWISGKGRMESKRLKSSEVKLFHNGKQLATLSGQHISFSQTIQKDKQQAPNEALIKVKGEGDVWGMAKLTYNQKMQKVQAGGKELRLERAYYLKKQKGDKLVFSELKEGDKLSKGDIIEVRLYLKLDRAMDFVQISDPRLLFAEHLDKHSRYIWGNSLTSYFYKVGEKATKLYFDKLARGEYHFSYQQAVVRSGRFSLPNASAQSLYAPEYSALTPFGGYQSVSE